jgi:hypothetical protein
VRRTAKAEVQPRLRPNDGHARCPVPCRDPRRAGGVAGRSRPRTVHAPAHGQILATGRCAGRAALALRPRGPAGGRPGAPSPAGGVSVRTAARRRARLGRRGPPPRARRSGNEAAGGWVHSCLAEPSSRRPSMPCSSSHRRSASCACACSGAAPPPSPSATRGGPPGWRAARARASPTCGTARPPATGRGRRRQGAARVS